MSSVITPRSRSTAYSSSPKSSPTGPTTRTSPKKLAASEKCTAEPPSMRSRSPNGVLTASNAIEPTTTRLMNAGRLPAYAARSEAGVRRAGPVERVQHPLEGGLVVRQRGVLAQVGGAAILEQHVRHAIACRQEGRGVGGDDLVVLRL